MKEKAIISLLAGLHERCGRGSSLHTLSTDIMAEIVWYLPYASWSRHGNFISLTRHCEGNSSLQVHFPISNVLWEALTTKPKAKQGLAENGGGVGDIGEISLSLTLCYVSAVALAGLVPLPIPIGAIGGCMMMWGIVMGEGSMLTTGASKGASKGMEFGRKIGRAVVRNTNHVMEVIDEIGTLATPTNSANSGSKRPDHLTSYAVTYRSVCKPAVGMRLPTAPTATAAADSYQALERVEVLIYPLPISPTYPVELFTINGSAFTLLAPDGTYWTVDYLDRLIKVAVRLRLREGWFESVASARSSGDAMKALRLQYLNRDGDQSFFDQFDCDATVILKALPRHTCSFSAEVMNRLNTLRRESAHATANGTGSGAGAGIVNFLAEYAKIEEMLGQ
jgi:hypothetical protein